MERSPSSIGARASNAAYAGLTRAAAASGLVGALLVASPSSAGDGRIELSHACATQTGCFTGDAPGYPITIGRDVGRSFLLTSDLVVPDENTSGIVIDTSSVTIDLNRFRIVRSGCETATVSCQPGSGTGVGIGEGATSHPGIAVRNGSVIGMGSHGVALGEQSIVENLRAVWNREGGIAVGDASIIRGCGALGNGGRGLLLEEGVIATGNTVRDNGELGMSVEAPAHVAGNAVHDNASTGIFATFTSVVRGNSVGGNGGDGMSGFHGLLVTRNAVEGNAGDGIELNHGNLVLQNSLRDNGEHGLELVVPSMDPDLRSGYRKNVLSGNTGGTVTGGVNTGSNVCSGVPFCP